MEAQRLEAAIEAILFMMVTSVELDRIAQAYEGEVSEGGERGTDHRIRKCVSDVYEKRDV